MKRIVIAGLMICLMLGIVPVYAQYIDPFPLLVVAGLDDQTGIFMFQKGVYKQVDTGSIRSYAPDYAPDGMQFVYKRWSQISLDFAQQMTDEYGMFMWEGEMPSDIVIHDLRTGANTVIAGQPDDADPETLLNAIRRSAPRWSLDGNYIAWTEVIPMMIGDSFSDAYQLVVHDLPTNTTKILTMDLPPSEMYTMPHEVYWGEDGIYMAFLDFSDLGVQESFVLFSLTGERLLEVSFEANRDFPPALTWFVAYDDGEEVFAVFYPSGMLRLIDKTGAVEEVVGAAPQKYNRLASDGVANIMMPANGVSINYYVTNPNTGFQELLMANLYSVTQILISPDGTTAIYVDWMSNMIYAWRDMVIEFINPPLDDMGELMYVSEIVIGNQAIRILRS